MTIRPSTPALAIFGLLLAVGFLSGATEAAETRALNLEQMVDLSQEIVVGNVVGSATRWEGRLVVTITTIEIDEAIKGQRSGRIEITQVGGTATHPDTGLSVTMTASTQVGFQSGQDVLLFVARSPEGLRQIVGAQRGMYRVGTDPTTGVRRLIQGPKRLHATPGDRSQGDPADRAIEAEPVTLGEMRKRIHAHMDAAAARGAGGIRQ